MGTGVFLGDKKRPGRDADPSLPSSAVGRERVELYLYSPYGPYGLYEPQCLYKGALQSEILMPFVTYFQSELELNILLY